VTDEDGVGKKEAGQHGLKSQAQVSLPGGDVKFEYKVQLKFQ
jgi:hypothetical protein